MTSKPDYMQNPLNVVFVTLKNLQYYNSFVLVHDSERATLFTKYNK